MIAFLAKTLRNWKRDTVYQGRTELLTLKDKCILGQPTQQISSVVFTWGSAPSEISSASIILLEKPMKFDADKLQDCLSMGACKLNRVQLTYSYRHIIFKISMQTQVRKSISNEQKCIQNLLNIYDNELACHSNCSEACTS